MDAGKKKAEEEEEQRMLTTQQTAWRRSRLYSPGINHTIPKRLYKSSSCKKKKGRAPQRNSLYQEKVNVLLEFTLASKRFKGS